VERTVRVVLERPCINQTAPMRHTTGIPNVMNIEAKQTEAELMAELIEIERFALWLHNAECNAPDPNRIPLAGIYASATRPKAWNDSEEFPDQVRAAPKGWFLPKPLPDGKLPVKAFDIKAFLPVTVAPWVEDICERMQCPADFVGVSVIAALGSVIGRKIGILPEEYDDWYEVANLWAMIVALPGLLKSPAMMEALKILHYLNLKAHEDHKAAMAEYEKDYQQYETEKAAAKKAEDTLPDPPEKPIERQYIVNDTTYEALGEVMIENPNGFLVYRDELMSLLKPLERRR
jgi:hypothetical protein